MSEELQTIDVEGGDTEYGFIWGPMEVMRAAHIKSGKFETRAVIVGTKQHEVTVYVSPTGRSVRVYRDGKELT